MDRVGCTLTLIYAFTFLSGFDMVPYFPREGKVSITLYLSRKYWLFLFTSFVSKFMISAIRAKFTVLAVANNCQCTSNRK